MIEKETPRKLAVLLHADVVESTNLVRMDETLAHQRIRDAFRRFSETITQHGGIAHEIRGDALIAEFSKASDAVSASLTFQQANEAHNANLSDDIAPTLRVGIAMGEVVVADDTVTGEGIVLAQRLEQLTESGGVCLQDAVYQTLPKRLPFQYEYLGERKLKGFSERVKIYSVFSNLENIAPDSRISTQFGSDTANVSSKPAIAVLPFINLSDDPDQEYFSDGITEDVITTLSYWRWFPVIARNSTSKYKGSDQGAKTIAEELSARYIVEGSVRRSGTRVRITVELIDPINEHTLWAQKYDKDIEDIFDLQEDIANHIVASIEPRIHQAENRRIARRTPDSLDAWECCLQAQSIHNRMTKSEVGRAVNLLNRSVELDPQFGTNLNRQRSPTCLSLT